MGGDTLDLQFQVACGANGLVTTPGATRFYRSDGKPALQRTRLAVAAEARLEWLRLEAIAYSGCQAENQLTMTLETGAELIGWDVTALGLPAAAQLFAGVNPANWQAGLPSILNCLACGSNARASTQVTTCYSTARWG